MQSAGEVLEAEGALLVQTCSVSLGRLPDSENPFINLLV